MSRVILGYGMDVCVIVTVHSSGQKSEAVNSNHFLKGYGIILKKGID